MARNNNDQHYKTLFRVFLRELLEITHPDLVPKLRFEEARFLDKETFTDLLSGDGYRMDMDLVCEIPTVDGECRLVLVHIEITELCPHTVRLAEMLARLDVRALAAEQLHSAPK